MYKINDKVVITNNKNPYYRRRGTVSKGQYHLDGFPYYVVFTDGDWDYYAESELKPYIKKEKCCGLCNKIDPCVCKEWGCFDKVKKVSKPNHIPDTKKMVSKPLTWDKPIGQSFIPTSSRLEKVTVGDTEFYPSSQHTVTVQLKITAETKELAKEKVRRYLDRQMLEGSVE